MVHQSHIMNSGVVTVTRLTLLFLILGMIQSFGSSIDSNGEDNLEDWDSDEEGINFKGRWSYLPPQAEHLCAAKCRENSKPFGMLIGTRCQCLCPLNAPDYDLCSGNGPDLCYGFCQQIGYRAGGNCLYNSNCFCFCGKMQEYNVTFIYTTPTPGLRHNGKTGANNEGSS